MTLFGGWRITRAGILFIVGVLVLGAIVTGGIFLVKNHGEAVRRDEAIKIAEQTLKDFLTQINAGEADFDTLAREHSEGPTSSRGGDLGWADPNSYDPAFKNALSDLQVDAYHAPFRSSFGWHLVQLTGRRTLDATKESDSNRAYQLIYNRKLHFV